MEFVFNKIQFYDIKTRKIVEMSRAEVLKGVPIGYLPYPLPKSNIRKVRIPGQNEN